MDWIYYVVLILVQITGLFLNLLGLPGLWLMVGALAGYGYFTGFGDRFVGWPSVIALLSLAILAEIGEFLAGSAGAKSGGGRMRGMVGAMVGGIVGGILGSFIPIPILGTIIGACLGAFAGAAIAEYWDEGLTHAIRVGWGAAKGRAWGIAIKSALGIAMLIVTLVAAWPNAHDASAGGINSPTSLPTSAGAATSPSLESASQPATSPSFDVLE